MASRSFGSRSLYSFSVVQSSYGFGWHGGWTKTAPYGINVAYADFNQDCVIDVLDEQASAFRYGASFGSSLYSQRYDVIPQAWDYDYPPPRDQWGNEIGDDWTINILDVQFVFGRDYMNCAMFYDPETLMGMYSYESETPTGPGTACGLPVTDPPSASEYAVDPIGVVFYGNATASRLEQEAGEHDYPQLAGDPEQRFWEVGRCTFEDVDARLDREWTCTPPFDSCESWHFRAEVADVGQYIWWTDIDWPPSYGTTTWGIYATATPHFDDDCYPWEHFVPEVFPYPEELYPGFEGSGFEAGTYQLTRQFVTYGGHDFAGTEYWGNIERIQQGACATNQWPRGDGNVYYIRIP